MCKTTNEGIISKNIRDRKREGKTKPFEVVIVKNGKGKSFVIDLREESAWGEGWGLGKARIRSSKKNAYVQVTRTSIMSERRKRIPPGTPT